MSEKQPSRKLPERIKELNESAHDVDKPSSRPDFANEKSKPDQTVRASDTVKPPPPKQPK